MLTEEAEYGRKGQNKEAIMSLNGLNKLLPAHILWRDFGFVG